MSGWRASSRFLSMSGVFMGPIQLTAIRHILPVAGFLSSQGEPLPPLLERAGLPHTGLDDPTRLVPTARLWRFRDLAVNLTGCPELTLKTTLGMELSRLGPVGRMLYRAPTLGKAIENFGRYSRAESSSVVLNLRPCRDADQVFFSVHFNLHDVTGDWEGELYLLAWMLMIVRLFQPQWSPAEIRCVSSGTPDRLRALEPLTEWRRFSQHCTGFPMPASLLSLPPAGSRDCQQIPDVDEALLGSSAPAESTSGEIKQLIQAYADDRWLSIDEASDALGIHRRALQRQLAAERQTYSSILEETRSEMAASLLEETDASFSEIARGLGYSNLSNFNRAFRRWAAISPRAFREQRRAKGRARSTVCGNSAAQVGVLH
jgi:AraC-like DNA-binding protein